MIALTYVKIKDVDNNDNYVFGATSEMLKSGWPRPWANSRGLRSYIVTSRPDTGSRDDCNFGRRSDVEAGNECTWWWRLLDNASAFAFASSVSVECSDPALIVVQPLRVRAPSSLRVRASSSLFVRASSSLRSRPFPVLGDLFAEQPAKQLLRRAMSAVHSLRLAASGFVRTRRRIPRVQARVFIFNRAPRQCVRVRVRVCIIRVRRVP